MEDNAYRLTAVSEMSYMCLAAVHEHVRMYVHGLTLIDYFLCVYGMNYLLGFDFLIIV